MIPVYWSIAFIIAAAIPDFSGLTGLVAAVCILQFTYTFPPILAVAYMIKKNSMLDGEGFDPATGQVVKHDSGIKRVMRGFMKGKWYLNMFNILYFLGSLTLAALGAYGAIEVRQVSSRKARHIADNFQESDSNFCCGSRRLLYMQVAIGRAYLMDLGHQSVLYPLRSNLLSWLYNIARAVDSRFGSNRICDNLISPNFFRDTFYRR